MTTNKMIAASSSLTTFLRHMEGQVRRKREAGKHSTADQYRAVINWLTKFLSTEKENTTTLTANTVERFLTFLDTQEHLHTNSKKSYLCGLRAMYNRAVREGVLAPGITPFAGITLHAGKTAKRALTREVIEEIAGLDLTAEPRLQQAADFCLFSFLASGIPFIDLAHLTEANLQDGHILYQRRKTGTSVRIGLAGGLNSLINKYRTAGSPYLFPILAEERTPYETYKACLRYYNNCLKEIGLRLSTPVRLTSYVIRHTWATEALRQHTPVAVISQALGHTSEKTTRCYLAELDQSELNQANAIITASVERIVTGRGIPLFLI